MLSNPRSWGFQFQGNIKHFMKILKRKSITASFSINLFYCFFSKHKAVQCKLIVHALLWSPMSHHLISVSKNECNKQCIYVQLNEQTWPLQHLSDFNTVIYHHPLQVQAITNVICIYKAARQYGNVCFSKPPP